MTARAYEPFSLPVTPHHFKRTRLTGAQRDEIGFRRMDGDKVRALAAEYGVSTDIVRDCVPKVRG